jgi:alanine-synthesizing transaminase
MFAKRTEWNLETNELTRELARHRAARKPLLDLTVSNPTVCGFEYDAPAILRALSNPQSLAYRPDPKGLESARLAVARYYAERGDEVAAGDILLTTSTSEAYTFVFRTLCEPGGQILIPQPGYPLFDYLADIQDVRLTRYPLVYDHGWQIDFHALEQGINPRTRAIVVVHPNNPTGHFAKPEEARRLEEICAAREMAILADEVFFDFALGPNQPKSFTANAAALTFTFSGLSKISGLPQMKLAWLIVSGPLPLRNAALARLEVIADTYLSVNTPVQLAAEEFLGQRQAFQKQLMSRVRKNLAELDRQIAAQKSCTRLELEGGWYAVLRVPSTRSDDELALELLRAKNVYVHPGHFYDFPAEGYLVVSLITPEQTFAQGMARLLSLF